MSEPTQRQRQQPNWLNNTVLIGKDNISTATILLAVLGISVAFGTSWLSGVFSEAGLRVIFVIIAASIAYQNYDLGIGKALAAFVTFLVLLNGILWITTDYLAEKVITLDVSKWQQVGGELSASAPDFGEGWLADEGQQFDNTAVALPMPDYNFGGGDPATIPTATVPDSGAVVPAAPLMPAATPDPVIALLYDLNTAVTYHDRAAAKTAAQAILRIEPGNSQAKAALAEIASAEATLINKQHMPVTPTYAKVNGEDGRVLRALRGGRYLVVQQDAPGVIALACQKIATIQETDGWLTGEQYQVKWCLLDQFNITKAGQSFAVPGE